MSIYEAIIELIGSAPEGYEPLGYIVVATVLLFLLSNCFLLIGSVVKRLGGS